MKNKAITIRKTRLQDQGKERDLEGTTPEERFAMVHVLTKNAWAMKGIDIDNIPLRKDIVRVVRLEDKKKSDS